MSDKYFEKIDLVETSLQIQAFSKLILSRPTREEYKLYQEMIFKCSVTISTIKYDEVYKEMPQEAQTEISLAVSEETKE